MAPHTGSAIAGAQATDNKSDSEGSIDIVASPPNGNIATVTPHELEKMKSKVSPFIFNCFRIVSDPATDSVVTWNRDGDAIVIFSKQRMASTVLPNYFKTRSFESFVRQLNFYGFRKRANEWGSASCFAHPDFKRGSLDRLELIKKRRSVKKMPATATKRIVRLEDEMKNTNARISHYEKLIQKQGRMLQYMSDALARLHQPPASTAFAQRSNPRVFYSQRPQHPQHMMMASNMRPISISPTSVESLDTSISANKRKREEVLGVSQPPQTLIGSHMMQPLALISPLKKMRTVSPMTIPPLPRSFSVSDFFSPNQRIPKDEYPGSRVDLEIPNFIPRSGNSTPPISLSRELSSGSSSTLGNQNSNWHGLASSNLAVRVS